MVVEVQRTLRERMTDMYVVRFAPPQARWVAFRRKEFEQLFDIRLERGQKIFAEFDLTKVESGV